MNLNNKRVLITAGPTWVPIDSVRVISNISTGKTGLLLAKKLEQSGARVTLLLGPVETSLLEKKIKVLRFRFFDELRAMLFDELRSRKYDFVIQAAAISDYRPRVVYKKKLASDKLNLKLNLVRLPKIIDRIKKLQKNAFLVGFKFIPRAKQESLIEASRKLLQHSGADLVVANSLNDKNYSAYLVDKNCASGRISSKENLVDVLTKRLIKL